MGYRSDVAAVFYTKDAEQWGALRLFVDENFPDTLRGELEPIGSIRYCGYKLSLTDTKWYDGHDEVKAFNAFVSRYKELADEVPWQYEFIRIGEDADDIEEDINGTDVGNVLRVERSIECDF